MKFVLLTTSQAGVNFAKGLQHAGHQLVAVGRGSSAVFKPVGAISSLSLRRQIGPNIPIRDLSIESTSDLTEFLLVSPHDVVVISWPKILPNSVLSVGKNCFIGTHPTPLPLGRGRHPLHWMRVLGLRTSRITAFRVDAGVDSGPIIASVRFRTSPRHSINDDLDIVESKQYWLGLRVGVRLWFGIPAGRPQDKDSSTMWRKRNESDTKIDFRMSAEGIVQHVRSFSSPFPMASIDGSMGKTVRVLGARRAAFALIKRKNRWSIFGTVLKSIEHKDGSSWILVRCFGGAVWLSIALPPLDEGVLR